MGSPYRNQAIGQHMIAWAVRDARRFYARLGFTASHEGFKLDLAESTY